MESFPLIAVLALFTFGAVILFAIRSKAKVEEKLDDPHAERSALAKGNVKG